jgi:hypothetical protein
MDLFKELMEMMEEEEKQKNTEKRIITPAEYLADYRKKVKKFCELSVGSHKHNTFTPDHESTLTKTGFYELGNKLRLITSSFDETFTLVEAGAGTGVGSHFMLAGLFAENFPISCISIRIREKEKKAKINKYIYTDPFNELQDLPAIYKEKISIQKKKTDIFGVIHGIQQDASITNAILLVVCPPPIHDDRNTDAAIAEQLVSTDVMALVESVNCTKIKHVVIVRYDMHGRAGLDGTVDFHSYHVPVLQEFGKWFLQEQLLCTIDSYSNSYGDDYYRCLHWFSRHK